MKDAFGNEVRYRGRWVNTGRILANQFIVMHPGDRREADVDLRVEYDYGLGGAFSVKYVLPLDREPDRDGRLRLRTFGCGKVSKGKSFTGRQERGQLRIFHRRHDAL